MDPAAPSLPTVSSDWLTILNDLRRSVNNLVLYVLECVPLAAFPFLEPPAARHAVASSKETLSIPGDGAFPHPPTTLEEAIQSLVTQEPWLKSDLVPQQPQQPQQQQQPTVSPSKKSAARKKKSLSQQPPPQPPQQQQPLSSGHNAVVEIIPSL